MIIIKVFKYSCCYQNNLINPLTPPKLECPLFGKRLISFLEQKRGIHLHTVSMRFYIQGLSRQNGLHDKKRDGKSCRRSCEFTYPWLHGVINPCMSLPLIAGCDCDPAVLEGKPAWLSVHFAALLWFLNKRHLIVLVVTECFCLLRERVRRGNVFFVLINAFLHWVQSPWESFTQQWPSLCTLVANSVHIGIYNVANQPPYFQVQYISYSNKWKYIHDMHLLIIH